SASTMVAIGKAASAASAIRSRRSTAAGNPWDHSRRSVRPARSSSVGGRRDPAPTRGRNTAHFCEHLRLRAKPDVLWLHVPNGGLRSKREAARFKRMGVLAGASNLLLWHRGNSFALELKSLGGRLSDAQLEFLARFNDAGGHSANAEGIDRALRILEDWGLLR